MNSVNSVSAYIIEHASSLAVEIVEYNIAKLEFEVQDSVKHNIIHFQTEFIQFLGEAITYENDQMVADGFHKWYRKYEQQGAPPEKVSSIVAPYADVRLFFNKRITAICEQYSLTLAEASLILQRLNYMLDIGLTKSIVAYEEYTIMEDQKRQKEIIRLSSAIVPVKEDVAVLPLIGSIDHEKAEYLIHTAIPKISGMGIHCLIIDFSGIKNLDPEISQYIFKIYKMLVLLGISVIFTGIRPDIASNAVKNGIHFASVKTYSNVKEAIKHMEIKRTNEQ
ncbi:STAS domain-containing protein [Heyndrickxia acidicola]|uniref:STAS domain-containing protein n=1 Tax=Heyndrickxia acidicola TaxID=209389 RepID=A0ABU6MI37_9BACI|nr:STAS domain-containing protein [Heyndrickxia acidicola]MED1204341.1 STAS domain-containing protein [Heyndrickxia acidicola]